MKIVFAADHAGYHLKNELFTYVRDKLGYEVEDFGAHEEDPDDDYTDFIRHAAECVHDAPGGTKAIILGGSGQGEAMLANGFDGVRAAVYYGGPEDIITLSRVHNDANVLSLGARFLDTDTAKYAVKRWLETEHPLDERYDARIEKMEAIKEDE